MILRLPETCFLWKIRTLGKICILDIDVQGVQSVKRSQLDCKYLFIEPPSLLELESRLKGRNTETAEKIKIRLQNAAGEMQYGKAEGNFDAIITNAEVEKSFSELVKQLQKWYPDVDLTFWSYTNYNFIILSYLFLPVLIYFTANIIT